MSPDASMTRFRLGLRTGLERDVYLIVKKLQAANDDRPFSSISAAYEAIKRSNSSLARQKKRPLEDAIDRVLRIRKQELQQDQSDDSEAAIDKPESPKTGDERFFLNRQMTKLWNMDSGTSRSSEQPAAKKRRMPADGDDDERAIGPEAAAAAPVKSDRPPARKAQKLSRYAVEQPERMEPLEGVDDVYRSVLLDAWTHLRCPVIYTSHHLPLTPGILLSGPSGVGKKTLVRNMATMLGVPLVCLTGCFQDPERTERSLSEAIDTALSLAPSIVLIEQIDQYMPRPASSGHGEHVPRAVYHFANQMARIRRSSSSDRNILAMATTSRISDIDPAVLKPGLFEKRVKIGMPDCASRRAILTAVTRRMELTDDVDLDELANMTHGFVGSDLAAIAAIVGDKIAKRIALAHDSNGVLLDRCFRLGDGAKRDAAQDPNHFLKRMMDYTPGPAPATMGDFKAAVKDFTPSLRMEGFSVIPSVTWDQVGALDEVRKQLQLSIIGPIKDPGLYQTFGLTRPAGVLLWGPPGCGKTLVAQAVANEARASFIMINGPELLNKYVGESERAVRELFERARSSTPCILFFDEMDSLVPPRASASTEASARVVNTFLAELDGYQDRSGIYVIGTTNRPDMMDRAMLRPGRLSVQLFVGLPTPGERVDILRAIYRTRHRGDARPEALVRLAGVALDARCAGFSGADLGGLHTRAAQHALEAWAASDGSGARVIAEADWEHALANTRASVAEPARGRACGEGLGA